MKRLSTPADILAASLRKEQAAWTFYDNLLNETQVSFVRDLLEQLREEEARHIQLVKRRLASLEAGRG